MKRAKKPSPNSWSCMPGCATMAALLVILGLVGVIGYRFLSSPLEPGSRSFRSVIVPKGASARSIAHILTADHIVGSARAFEVAVVLADARQRLRPGTYRLSPGMTPSEIVATLVAGKTESQDIVVPPGFTLKQIADRLEAAHLASRSEFLDLAIHNGRSFHGDHGFTPPDDNLEGYLYPDTYRISPGMPARMIIGEMLNNFELHVVRRHPNVVAWREPIIVASMVEREAKVPSDQPKIASVIYNRLRTGMTLGIDATIEYALPVHKSRLTFADYGYQSPYNTYLRRGLTPTPICSPGDGAIDAALHPDVSQYLYYVAGPGGKHVFTKTLAEHDAVIRRIRSGVQPD